MDASDAYRPSTNAARVSDPDVASVAGGVEPGPLYRGRFAPSPTGPLHLGSLLTALGSWLLARHVGGQWLIRIEDVDRLREVPGAAEKQLATLAAFGLVSDIPVVRQSRRNEAYQAAVQRLLAQGDAFVCACSRRALAAVGGVHRLCLDSSQAVGRRSGIRLRVADGLAMEVADRLQGRHLQRLDRAVGDFILRRADGAWAYQLAVVVDDAEQGVSAVVRGADLLDSTPRQLLLQQKLGLAAPEYWHLPLLLGSDGRKLSKSRGDAAVDARDPLPAMRLVWRALGQPPAVLRGRLTPTLALALAQREFVPDRLPKRRGIRLAALHDWQTAMDV